MSRRRLNTQATSRRQVNWTTASSWRRPGMRLQEQWPPAKDESSTTSVASAASLILPNPVDWRAFQSPRPFPSFSSPPILHLRLYLSFRCVFCFAFLAFPSHPFLPRCLGLLHFFHVIYPVIFPLLPLFPRILIRIFTPFICATFSIISLSLPNIGFHVFIIFDFSMIYIVSDLQWTGLNSSLSSCHSTFSLLLLVVSSSYFSLLLSLCSFISLFFFEVFFRLPSWHFFSVVGVFVFLLQSFLGYLCSFMFLFYRCSPS